MARNSKLLHGLHRLWAPASTLDRGYVDALNPQPSSEMVPGYGAEGPIAQYVANRFTRGSIRGQIRVLLTKEGIAERFTKAQAINWRSN